MNYVQADSKLTGKCKQSRKISYSCKLVRRDNGRIAVKMHSTDIITFEPNGDAIVDVGNWETVTTKARLNDFLPFGRIYSDRGTWYVSHAGSTLVFANGMVFHADGTITGACARTVNK